jgi:hypothetical protein
MPTSKLSHRIRAKDKPADCFRKEIARTALGPIPSRPRKDDRSSDYRGQRGWKPGIPPCLALCHRPHAHDGPVSPRSRERNRTKKRRHHELEAACTCGNPQYAGTDDSGWRRHVRSGGIRETVAFFHPRAKSRNGKNKLRRLKSAPAPSGFESGTISDFESGKHPFGREETAKPTRTMLFTESGGRMPAQELHRILHRLPASGAYRAYWPFPGTFLEVIEEENRRFIIISL